MAWRAVRHVAARGAARGAARWATGRAESVYPRAQWTPQHARRVALWDEEAKRQAQARAAAAATQIAARVGEREVAGAANELTPWGVLTALGGAPEGARAPLVSRVDGATLWDLSRPLPRSCRLEFLDSSFAEARQVMWHSAAHVLGCAAEALLPGARLADGPALAGGGFFYDVAVAAAVAANSLARLSAFARRFAAEKWPFERLAVAPAFAARVFEDNPLKLELLERIAAAAEATAGDADAAERAVTLYRCGPFVDLCRGPHVRHTGAVRAFELTHASAARHGAIDVQRVYGVAFPSEEELAQWRARRAEAEARDHRVLGRAQRLFWFHPWAAGSPFFLPHGTRVYNRLLAFLRAEYVRRGYQEVRTPQLFARPLWERSGHWGHYRDNMFLIQPSSHASCAHHTHAEQPQPQQQLQQQGEGAGEAEEQLALKPMNCPGHCLLFASESRSYRELPLRLADFSPLHRNEFSGALSGLTRVRRFSQDDAHIFCAPAQVAEEVAGCLDFVRAVYGVFSFEFRLRLSTRPDDAMGSDEQWAAAEAALREALTRFGHSWAENPKDGAFYGPKIDVAVLDALGREHQCATVQLDFNLPQRFDLAFVNERGARERPVLVHRAVLGSLERFIALLTEHLAGRWPFWLSPRQVAVLPVSRKALLHARAVQRALEAAELWAEVDETDATLARKVREAQTAGFNVMAVVGEAEAAAGAVAVRAPRHGEAAGDGQQLPLADFIARLSALAASRA